jgi:23S rRNA (guanosine2251-2'-O)-methyltransferase
VIVPERGGALLDDDVVRASAGAVLHVPVARCGNLAQTLRDLRDHGYWVYGMAGEGRESVFTCRWADRSALVMGNETEGLRPATAKACDLLVRIPLCRDMDSLNVSVAAGVALFQAGNALGVFKEIRGDA